MATADDAAGTEMTPTEIRAARDALGLTQAELATVLGYGAKERVSELERGVRDIGGSASLLLKSYLDGYRPANWPQRARAVETGGDDAAPQHRGPGALAAFRETLVREFDEDVVVVILDQLWSGIETGWSKILADHLEEEWDGSEEGRLAYEAASARSDVIEAAIEAMLVELVGPYEEKFVRHQVQDFANRMPAKRLRELLVDFGHAAPENAGKDALIPLFVNAEMKRRTAERTAAAPIIGPDDDVEAMLR